MAAKKKGKGRKKLTAVELERRRIEEADTRKRELAMLQTRLRDILEQEKAMTASASSAIEARWVTFLRECKHKELVASVEKIRRSFETSVDRNDAAIAALFEDLQEAEDQYRHAFRGHVESVESLMSMQQLHMEELQNEYENDLVELKNDFESERRMLEEKHDSELADLRLILHNMAAEAELLERKLQEETSETRETAIEKMDEEKKQMQVELAHTSDALRAELDSRYKEFMTTAQVNMKDYMDKSKEDQETTERIASQLKKIDKLQESVTSWRTNISRNAKEWEQRNRAMQAERDATLRHLKALKNKMQAWRDRQAHTLAELVKDAKSSEDSLTGTSKKAERILRLIELCKPLETEREQVMSFEQNTSQQAIEQDVRVRVAIAEDGDVADAAPSSNTLQGSSTAAGDWQLLEKFWLKHNKVVLDNAAIAQERHHLQAENQQLQGLLRQYLNDVTVTDEVMRQDNTLLQTRPAVKNVVQVAEMSANGGVKPYSTVVEGNKFVTDRSRQGIRQ